MICHLSLHFYLYLLICTAVNAFGYYGDELRTPTVTKCLLVCQKRDSCHGCYFQRERNVNDQENVSVKKEFCNSQRELSNAFVWD